MIERIHPGLNAGKARTVIFDFDGTLSLIRSGWVDTMVPMMVEVLLDQKSGESEQELRAVVEDYVSRLTGKQTIYQMMELARQVELRGGRPLDPLAYKKIYLELLWQKIKGRVEDLRDGRVDPDRYLVPGSVRLLENLESRGLKMYLASGTDEAYAREEARLLGLERYFAGGVHGAQDDYKSFSKAILIQRVIQSGECRGEEILGFGDGFVEIENVKQVGGVAVGVATSEPECLEVDPWKRERLAGIGADFIVPNYLCCDELMGALFPSTLS